MPSEYKPPPNISPPENKVKGETQVLLLNLSKTGIYVNSNMIKRYQDGFRQVLKENKDDFVLENTFSAYDSDT